MNGATTVYGATSIGGAITATSTLNVTGLTTLGNASTTQLSIAGNLWINGFATTTSSGNINGQGILTMLGTGTSTFSGGIQSTALNITSATASSTFANGIILSKGCFLMPDGTCAGAGSGGGTINSGTIGQFPYYAGSGTTLTATSSLFLSSNQNLGIGTTTPNWLLQVAGTRPFLTLSDTGASANLKHWFLSSQGGNLYVGTSSDALATSTVSALTINSNGFVGIATTSPGSLFSLSNIANFTNATSTFYSTGGINLNDGCFAIDGTCVGAGGGSGTINSGTTGQFSYYAGSGTTLTATSSIFLSSNQNIGIGTTTPNWLLQVAGVRPFFTLSDTGAAANNKHWFLSSQGGNFYVGTSSDALNATSTYLSITNGGNVGIGTTNPGTNKLKVIGDLGISTDDSTTANPRTGAFVDLSSGEAARFQFGDAFSAFQTAFDSRMQIYSYWGLELIGSRQDLSSPSFVTGASGDPAVSILSPAATRNVLVVKGAASQTGDLQQWQNSDGAVLSVVNKSGNVGIGTTSPYAKLSIVGETVSTYFTATLTTATSTFLGAVGVGTSTPAEQLSVSGRLFVGGTGTSTIQNNLYVMGTLRSTVSYVGDLIFSNNFRFIETNQDEKIQSLFLNNQRGENLFKIDENGKVVVKEIEAEKIQSKKIGTEELQIGSPQNRTGITIYDKKTGNPVCIFSENSILKSIKGECK